MLEAENLELTSKCTDLYTKLMTESEAWAGVSRMHDELAAMLRKKEEAITDLTRTAHALTDEVEEVREAGLEERAQLHEQYTRALWHVQQTQKELSVQMTVSIPTVEYEALLLRHDNLLDEHRALQHKHAQEGKEARRTLARLLATQSELAQRSQEVRDAHLARTPRPDWRAASAQLASLPDVPAVRAVRLGTRIELVTNRLSHTLDSEFVRVPHGALDPANTQAGAAPAHVSAHGEAGAAPDQGAGADGGAARADAVPSTAYLSELLSQVQRSWALVGRQAVECAFDGCYIPAYGRTPAWDGTPRHLRVDGPIANQRWSHRQLVHAIRDLWAKYAHEMTAASAVRRADAAAEAKAAADHADAAATDGSAGAEGERKTRGEDELPMGFADWFDAHFCALVDSAGESSAHEWAYNLVNACKKHRGLPEVDAFYSTLTRAASHERAALELARVLGALAGAFADADAADESARPGAGRRSRAGGAGARERSGRLPKHAILSVALLSLLSAGVAEAVVERVLSELAAELPGEPSSVHSYDELLRVPTNGYLQRRAAGGAASDAVSVEPDAGAPQFVGGFPGEMAVSIAASLSEAQRAQAVPQLLLPPLSGAQPHAAGSRVGSAQPRKSMAGVVAQPADGARWDEGSAAIARLVAAHFGEAVPFLATVERYLLAKDAERGRCGCASAADVSAAIECAQPQLADAELHALVRQALGVVSNAAAPFAHVDVPIDAAIRRLCEANVAPAERRRALTSAGSAGRGSAASAAGAAADAHGPTRAQLKRANEQFAQARDRLLRKLGAPLVGGVATSAVSRAPAPAMGASAQRPTRGFAMRSPAVFQPPQPTGASAALIADKLGRLHASTAPFAEGRADAGARSSSDSGQSSPADRARRTPGATRRKCASRVISAAPLAPIARPKAASAVELVRASGSRAGDVRAVAPGAPPARGAAGAGAGADGVGGLSFIERQLRDEHARREALIAQAEAHAHEEAARHARARLVRAVCSSQGDDTPSFRKHTAASLTRTHEHEEAAVALATALAAPPAGHASSGVQQLQSTSSNVALRQSLSPHRAVSHRARAAGDAIGLHASARDGPAAHVAEEAGGSDGRAVAATARDAAATEANRLGRAAVTCEHIAPMRASAAALAAAPTAAAATMSVTAAFDELSERAAAGATGGGRALPLHRPSPARQAPHTDARPSDGHLSHVAQRLEGGSRSGIATSDAAPCSTHSLVALSARTHERTPARAEPCRSRASGASVDPCWIVSMEEVSARPSGDDKTALALPLSDAYASSSSADEPHGARSVTAAHYAARAAATAARARSERQPPGAKPAPVRAAKAAADAPSPVDRTDAPRGGLAGADGAHSRSPKGGARAVRLRAVSLNLGAPDACSPRAAAAAARPVAQRLAHAPSPALPPFVLSPRALELMALQAEEAARAVGLVHAQPTIAAAMAARPGEPTPDAFPLRPLHVAPRASFAASTAAELRRARRLAEQHILVDDAEPPTFPVAEADGACGASAGGYEGFANFALNEQLTRLQAAAGSAAAAAAAADVVSGDTESGVSPTAEVTRAPF